MLLYGHGPKGAAPGLHIANYFCFQAPSQQQKIKL